MAILCKFHTFIYLKYIRFTVSKQEFTIKGETLRELRNIGDLNMTEESVLLDLISHAKCCDRWWEDRFD